MKSINDLLKRKKLIVFDLDGVLVDTKSNMKIAWNYTAKRNNIKIPFKKYFKFVGLPFKDIIINLKIDLKKNNYQTIKKDFQDSSISNMSRVRCFENAKKVLLLLKKKRKKIALLTSKDYRRSKLLIKKFNFKFNLIECGSIKKKGKPDPFQMNLIIKRLKLDKKKTVYIGDMFADLKTAKNAKIDFIFAKYGYGKLPINKTKFKINRLTDLIK